MSHTERDLTPILDHVARAHHNRMVASLSEEQRASAPTFEQVPAGARTALKSNLLPLVMDVLTALDAQDQNAADHDVLAALEAQFADSAESEGER